MPVSMAVLTSGLSVNNSSRIKDRLNGSGNKKKDPQKNQAKNENRHCQTQPEHKALFESEADSSWCGGRITLLYHVTLPFIRTPRLLFECPAGFSSRSLRVFCLYSVLFASSNYRLTSKASISIRVPNDFSFLEPAALIVIVWGP
jgi:hypothetical protein